MNEAIRLIINADDLGAGTETDRGIVDAFRSGIVTSASLLATGPSLVSAARQAGDAGLPVGVHLNLSEGVALSGPIAGLTDDRGRFPGKIVSRERFASGHLDPARLTGELTAQIERVRQAGLEPDHLDTHQHCGLFPVVTTALLAAARTTRIGRMRLPAPVEPSASLPGDLGRELQLYRQLVPAFASAAAAAGLSTPDGLFGMPLLDRLDAATLAATLTSIPAGTWELMVHPGYADPQNPFTGPQRCKELSALTGAAARQLVLRSEIDLISFGALPCAC